MKILITGDSHTGPLNRGLNALRRDKALDPQIALRVKPLGGGHLINTPFWEARGDHIRIVDEEYRQNFKRLPPWQSDFDAIGLSLPYWPVRLVYRMNVARLSLVAPIAGYQPISRATFRQILRRDQAQVLGFAEALSQCGVRVFAVAGPRLFRDNKVLGALPPDQAQAICAEYFGFMAQELADRGIDIVDVPPETLDQDGFTRPEFRNDNPDDNHHANPAFGALMIRRIEDWARKTL